MWSPYTFIHHIKWSHTSSMPPWWNIWQFPTHGIFLGTFKYTGWSPYILPLVCLNKWQPYWTFQDHIPPYLWIASSSVLSLGVKEDLIHNLFLYHCRESFHWVINFSKYHSDGCLIALHEYLMVVYNFQDFFSFIQIHQVLLISWYH